MDVVMVDLEGERFFGQVQFRYLGMLGSRGRRKCGVSHVIQVRDIADRIWREM